MRFRILHYPTVDSTNTTAKEFAEKGASEGTVLFADYQTKGRGRLGRRWVSPRGKDLLFSVLFRPKKLKANRTPAVTQVTASSVRRFLEKETGLEFKVKKPNDVLVDGKKVCGILVESGTSSGYIDYLIVGVGLNVNSRERQLPAKATSLLEVTGREYDRLGLLETLLKVFERDYFEFLTSSTG